MPARKSQFQIWYEQVKRELLITEPQNILARSECCQNIINECVTRMNINLGLPTLLSTQQYVCNVITTQHLKFLLNWPGLRVDNSPKAPKTKKEYEKKSKNWLNGRRAPNYGKTLFPFFISEAEKYISSTCKILISDDEEKEKLYYDIVIYKVLAQLCGCSVSLHEQAKKAPFFCKNSVERKGRLKEILQSYASDHEYIQGFPSCFEEAIGYFDRKSNKYFHSYRKKYLGYNKHNNMHDNNDEIDTVASIHSNTNTRYVIKRSPTSNSFSSSSKKERGCKSASADAEYWKKQFLNLKQELSAERRIRMNAERERDNLKTLININTSTDNMHMNMNGHNNINALSLNDNCYDSINGSLSTTSSSTFNNHVQASHSFNIHKHQLQHQSHQSRSIHNMNMMNNMNNMNFNNMNNMNRYGPAIPPNYGTIYANSNGNINNQTTFSSLNNTNNTNNMSNMSNMSNMNNLNNLNNQSSFVIPHNNRAHAHIQPSLVFQPSLNEMPSNDAFSSIIDTMPMMNRPQLSNESFPGLHDGNINTSVPNMYSFQNSAAIL